MNTFRHKINPLHSIIFVLALCYISLPRETLIYQHNFIQTYEWYRGLSGHFIHNSVNHLLLNSAGILILSSLYGKTYNAVFWYTHTLITSVLISGMFLLFFPNIHWYLGFSGVLVGLFTASSSMHYYKERSLSSAGIFIFVSGKTCYEFFWQRGFSSKNVLLDIPTAVEGHCAGWIAGLTLVVVQIISPKLWDYFKQP